SAAAGPEDGDGARMRLLHFNLIEARVVAGPVVAVEDGGMAGVARGDGDQLAVLVFDGEHRHIVVAWPFELAGFAELGDVVGFVLAAVDGEVSSSVSPGEGCRREFAECLLDNGLNGTLQLVGELVDQPLLLL